MKIKKGDTVLIITGKDKNRKGKVIEVLPKINKIVIEGLNVVRKHLRPKRTGEKGQKVEIPKPMNVSNVKLICPKCGQPVRVGYRITEAGKFRVCKKCESEI